MKSLDSSGRMKVGGVPLLTFSTTLPTNPVDQDEIVYLPDNVGNPSKWWHLKYHAATNRWVKIGGPPLYKKSTPAASGSGATDTPVSIAAPQSGLYNAHYGAQGSNNAIPQSALLSLVVEGVSVDSVSFTTVSAGAAESMVGDHEFAVAADGGIVKLQVGGGGGTTTASDIWLRLDCIYING